ncbi:MAG: restriction endonuclease subunit S [Dehalococcoidia bacterium]|nr:restriction endonuclease subunit S [Dehalococcoidia bacterium]
MEVTPGYKRSDIGVIPQEWEVVRFSKLFEFRNGVNADKDAYGRGTPFVNVLEIITKGHLKASDVPGKVSLPRSAVVSYAVRRGDLVFNRTSETQAEVGLAAVYLDDVPVVFGGFVIRGRPTTADVDAIFSGYAFRAPSVRSQIIARGQGAIRANVGQGDLRQIVAALPPRPEQEAIAEALSDADALIESLEQLIAKKLTPQARRHAGVAHRPPSATRLQRGLGDEAARGVGRILERARSNEG